jgi:hypothetical protein
MSGPSKLLSHTCHSEERRDEESAVIDLSFRIRFSGEESAVVRLSIERRGAPGLAARVPYSFALFAKGWGTFL